MSSAFEFRVFLIGADALADRTLHKHLRRQYAVHHLSMASDVEPLAHDHAPDVRVCEQLALVLKRALESRELSRIHRDLRRELKFADAVIRHENDHMTRTLQETHPFDKLVFISDKMAEV